jgi:hypothetical protein
VFDLQHARAEYTQFFSHLDEHQGAAVSPNCRLVYSHNAAGVLMHYLENFIYSNDTVFVGEMASHWALNKNYEATEWLRELESLSDAYPMRVPEIMHNPPSA